MNKVFFLIVLALLDNTLSKPTNSQKSEANVLTQSQGENSNQPSRQIFYSKPQIIDSGYIGSPNQQNSFQYDNDNNDYSNNGQMHIMSQRSPSGNSYNGQPNMIVGTRVVKIEGQPITKCNVYKTESQKVISGNQQEVIRIPYTETVPGKSFEVSGRLSGKGPMPSLAELQKRLQQQNSMQYYM